MAFTSKSNSSFLRVGDTVLFFFKTVEKSGYVYSELSSSPFNFLSLLQSSSSNPRFSNVNFAAFQVLAPNKYKATQRLKDLKEQESSPEYEIANAKRAVDSENAENLHEQSRRFGTTVLYGDLVQFLHVGSKKYVTVCSEASRTESNNLLVNLSNDNSEGAIFKILPRYKVRSEGDGIHFHDQIKLESFKTQGQFLHIGSRSLDKAGYKPFTDCYEVNLSASESALSLQPHFSPSSNQPPNALRGGKCVRLFHKEDECYIVAEGSFASPSSPVHEEVHCRQRRVDSKNHAMPSTSANTFWQIEKVDIASGDVISWGESCRIKHMPTRLYLSIDYELQVKLKQPNEDDADFGDTLFSFHPLIQEGDAVLFESYACIKHLLSGEWLHLEKKEEYVRRKYDPNAKGLAGLEVDSAELFMLKTRKDRGDYDSFTLQEVSEDLLDNFNYLAGIVPVLTSHIENIEENGAVVQSSEKQSSDVRESLYEVRKWVVTDKDRDTKNRQKLLRNLKVIEQLVEILHSGNFDDIESSQKAICRECYNVIKKYLEGDSRKNENYLAKFIEKFQQHVRKDLNAEEVLVEIVQDNINIVSRMAETQLSSMIEQFCLTKDPRFLEFLSSLCVCNDRPIPSTQEKLLQYLVMDKGMNIFIRTLVKKVDGQNVVYFYLPGNEDKPTCMRNLGDPANARRKTLSQIKDLSKSLQIYDLLDAQLFLFSRLCKGNNSKSINALLFDPESNPSGYVNFSQAISVVQDSMIDIRLRIRYAEIILVMFVDFGVNRSFLDNLCYSFVYDEIVAEPYTDTGNEEGETIALTGAENIYFPEIKTWILNVLQSYEQLRSDLNSEAQNEFLEKVIDVLSYLVRYGYYDDLNDVDCCMEHLIRLLDGRTDLPSQGREVSVQDMEIFRKKERKEDIPENKTVFDVKHKALQVMELFFRFKFYVKLQKFVYDFKVLSGSGRKAVADKKKLSFNLNTPPQILSQLTRKTTIDDEWLHEPHFRRAAMTRLNTICNKTERSCGFPPKNASLPSLESVLLDLATYDCDKLVTSSLNLLIQMYFFEEELFGKAVQAQLLIAPQSIQDFRHVNEVLPELRQLLRVDSNKRVQNRITVLLDQLSELCVTSGDSYGEIISLEQNQVMLDNLGVVSEILSYVLSKGDQSLQSVSIDDDSLSVKEEVFISCFRLLRNLAAGRKNVQKRLFNRVDDLLELRLPGDALAHVADLLTEVFTGGPELILKISQTLIEKIFEIIVDSHSSLIQASFMITLQAMAKIEELDLPVGRNHAIIVKNFCRLRHSFCEELLAEKEGMDEKRMEILLKDEETSLLQVLLGVTELLATCAESRNLFIESVCRNIFTSEELLSIMTNEDMNPRRKIPFTKFFMLVYMKKGRNKQGFEVTHGKEVWKYLENIGELLNKIVQFFESVPTDEQATISRELEFSGRKSSSTAVSLEQSRSLLRTMSVKMAGITDLTGHIIPGLFQYITDSVLPLLHTFYCSFFNPMEQSAGTKQIEWEYQVSVLITKSLYKLSRTVLNRVSNSSSHLLYQEILTKLLEHERIELETDIDKSLIVSLVKQPSIESSLRKPARAGTLKRSATITSESNVITPLPTSAFLEYNDQKTLNNQFNQYARNFCAVYQGKNTVTFQIMSPVEDLEYSDEGEELPLGPSFQHLVSLFFIESSRKLKPEVECLLRQLEISNSSADQLNESDQLVQETLHKRCLQILRAMIVNQIKLIDPELKDRDAIKFRKKFDSSVVPVQNQLQNFNNAINRVTPLLSHSNEAISRGALALMKSLLFSGNREVQEGLCCSLRDTREETLFLHLKHRIEIATLNYKETTELELQVQKRQEEQPSILKKNEAKKESTLPAHSSAAKLLQNEQDEGTHIAVAISMDNLGSTDKLTGDKNPSSDASAKKATLLRSTNTLPRQDEESSDNVDDDEENIRLEDILASDNTWTTLVLEVIGLMCDGQHRTLQNYLRDQPDNFKTINVVAEVANLLHTYTVSLTSQNLVQVHKILQCLIEMCVGNAANQQVILDKLIVEPLNRILQHPVPTGASEKVYSVLERPLFKTPLELLFHSRSYLHVEISKGRSQTERMLVNSLSTVFLCHHLFYSSDNYFDRLFENEELIQMVQAKGSVVELISVMMEEIDPEAASTVIEGVAAAVDDKALIETIEFLQVMRSNAVIRRKEMDDDCERGMFRAYHILTTLIDRNKCSFKNIKALKKGVPSKTRDAINECVNHTRSVEIHYENEDSGKAVLAQVNFPYSSQNVLREDLTEKVRWNINRDSMEDKQRALLDLMPALKSDIHHQSMLKKTKILRPFLAYHTIRVYFLMALTLLLNLLVLITFSIPSENIDDGDDRFVLWPDASTWFSKYVLYILGTIHLLMSFWIVIEYFLINWPHFQLPQFMYFYWYRLVQIVLREQQFRQLPQFTFLDKNIFGVSTVYMLIFLCCSILSLAFRGYFYCVCLLFIVFASDILQRVLRAVTLHGKSLLWVAVLGFIVLFIYSVISFAWLHSYFIASNGLFCDTLSKCFYSMIKIGLLDTLANSIPLNSTGDPIEYSSHYPVRLIFDLSFFIIVTTIGLNIVFGIIVDSFGELREERSNVEAEQKSRCFVCDLPSYDFERKAKGFRNHVKRDHNMWNYVYYSLYVDTVDTGDHNAIQKYVHEKVAENDPSFFPQEEACCLTGDDDNTGQKLEELQEKVEGILQRFKEKDHEKSVRTKKSNQLKFEADIKAKRPSGLNSRSESFSVYTVDEEEL